MATIGSLVVDLIAETATFSKDMGKAADAAKSSTAKINVALAGVERGFQTVSRTISRTVGDFFSVRNVVAGLAGAGGFGLLVRGSLDAADSIGDIAAKAGVSTGFLQEMRYAAEQSGASSTDLDDAVTRLNRRLGLFATSGGGPAAKAIEQLGLNIYDAGGQVRATESIFNDAIQKLQAYGSEAERSAILSQLFGDDAGPRLLQLANQGAGGLDKLRQSARDLGLVISDDLISKSGDANDRLGTLAAVLKTKVTAAVVELAPIIDKFATKILAALPVIAEKAGKAMGFLADNMWLVGTAGGAIAGMKLGAAIGSIIPGIGTLVGAGVGAAAGGLLGSLAGGLFSSAEAGQETATALDQVADSGAKLERIGQAPAALTAAMKKAREEALSLLDQIDNRWLQSTGQQVALIEKRKREEIAALNESAANAQEKADAQVKIEQAAAAEIAAIGKRAADERARDQKRIADEAQHRADQQKAYLERIEQDYVAATASQIAQIERRRDAELTMLDELKIAEADAAEARAQINETASARIAEIEQQKIEQQQSAIERIETTYLQATGQMIALVERRRAAELAALDELGIGEERLAQLRVLVNQTAAAEIEDIQKREAEKLAKEQERAAKESERSWERFGDSTKGVLEDLVQGGKLSLQGLIRLADDALKAVLQASGAAGKGGQGETTSTGGLIGTAFASLLGFADGGRPPVGRPSIVGERGPELFVPDRPGTVIPNDFGSGGMGGNVINIDARGAAPGVEALIRRELAALSASIEPRVDARVMRQAGRGGAFAKAVGRR